MSDRDTKAFERGDHVELAERLVSVLRERSDEHVVADESAIHAYDPSSGIWTPLDDAELSRIVQRFAGTPSGVQGKPLKLKASDVAGAIKLATDQVSETDFFTKGPKGISFTNGFARVSASGVVIAPHAPENRARSGYPFAYERRAAPRFLAFLESIWRDDADKHEKMMLLQEFGGACLVGDATTYQRAIVSEGKGANGKGVTTTILIRAMPPGSTTAIAPQELGNEYRRAMLAGKRLNVVSELPEADIIDSEAFKAIVAGDPIVGRHIRQAPFEFTPVAGHFFSANRLPGTNDLTHGFWRRLIVLTYNRIFTADPENNPHIAQEITDAELPAIVAWFLDGAVRLTHEREYTLPASHAKALADWRRNADQVLLFVEEATRPLAAHEALGDGANDLYAAYKSWALASGHRPVASNKFGARMKELGKGSLHTERGNRYPLVATRGAYEANEVRMKDRVAN